MSFLFVDRIIESFPGESIKGLKHVTHEDSFLTVGDHGRWCFMSSLIGETLGQLAAWNVMAHHQFTRRPVAGIVANARLFRPVVLGETLLLESFIDQLDDTAVEYHSIARVGDEPVFSVDGAIGPLLPMTQFIDPLIVQRQYEALYRPGDWGAITLQMNTNSWPSSVPSDPIPCPALRFDRLIDVVIDEVVVAEKKINRAAPYFPDHFPNKPVLPMTVLLECIQNLAREFVALGTKFTQYQVRELRRIKMNDFVQPGDAVVCHMKVKQKDDDELALTCRCEVDGKRVCVLEVVLAF
jgi:3-hydroxymyristoyl/3-hydroxydecanoyl-(acyl carrier protein) dehydratase